MKVFIADDSAIIRELVKDMLEDIPNIEVIGEAAGGPEAIEVIQNLKPDVVILDIRMPGGSGIEVLEAIKMDRSHPKVIMLTNYDYPQYRKKCVALGAEYFFDKGTEFKELNKALEQLIQDLKD